MILTNENLAEHFHKRIWHSHIGGYMGEHTDTVPLIIDSPRIAGPVPGVPYQQTFMDNSTPLVHNPDYKETLNYLTNAQNGTWIDQTTYIKEKFQQVTRYINRFIKINSNQWQYFQARNEKFPDELPLGTDNNFNNFRF